MRHRKRRRRFGLFILWRDEAGCVNRETIVITPQKQVALGVFLYTCPRCANLTAKHKCPDCGSKVLP